MTLIAPFPAKHQADPFGDWPQWRKDMGLGPHRGKDFNGLDARTPVPASGTGVVTRSFWNNALGWVVVVAYAVGKRTLYIGYCHLAERGLPVGAEVELGDTVGLLGNTGSASAGYHLHLTASWEDGDPGTVDVVDPMPFFSTTTTAGKPGTRITKSEEDTMTVVIVDYGTAQPYPGKHQYRIGEEALAYLPQKEDPPANVKLDGPAIEVELEEFTRQCAARGIPVGRPGEANVPFILLDNGYKKKGATFWSRARDNADALAKIAKRVG